MKKIYMQPALTTFDLGETVTPLCASDPTKIAADPEGETWDVLSTGSSNSWEESSWKPADLFSDEEEL